MLAYVRAASVSVEGRGHSLLLQNENTFNVIKVVGATSSEGYLSFCRLCKCSLGR